jgi:hypothetical protein
MDAGMNRMSFFKNLLFVVFFTAGLGAIFLSILTDEIVNYYHIKISNAEILKLNESIKQQDSDTSKLIKDIEENPEILKHLAPIKFNEEPNNPDAIIVHVRDKELEAAQEVLKRVEEFEANDVHTPVWLKKCDNPPAKRNLFFGGSALIMISLTCFGVPRKKSEPQ